MRVRSGTRVMTVRQALKDEIQGGDFLALMTDKEYQKFQKLLCKRGIKEKQNTLTINDSTVPGQPYARQWPGDRTAHISASAQR